MKNWPGKPDGLPMPEPTLRRKALWRSMDDLAQSPEFMQWASAEFPALASELDDSYKSDGPSRRRFLQLMGASMALAGLSMGAGCRRTETRLLPAKFKTAEQVPGRAMYFASSFVLAGKVTGILAETNEGRPTKIEGNPAHPASMGATDVYAQASLLDLYDPDRSRFVLNQGQLATKIALLGMLDQLSAELKKSGGKGLAILSADYASPAIDMLREHLAKVLPQARFAIFEPSWFGQTPPASRHYDLSQYKTILSLDCDFLGHDDEGIFYKRAFGRGRAVENNKGKMNRLYAVEPGFSLTGTVADHRLRLPASKMVEFAGKLLGELQGKASGDAWISELASDLKAGGVVLAGARHPQAAPIVAQINKILGAKPVGRQNGSSDAPQALALGELLGQPASVVVLLGGNPVYDAPADLKVANWLKQAGNVIQLSSHVNETTEFCRWHFPAAHALESWGDARAFDGTLSPMQPMIDPLFGGLTALEVLARIGSYDTKDGYEIVRRSFKRLAGAADSDQAFRKYLHEGVFQPAGDAGGKADPNGSAAPSAPNAEPTKKVSDDRPLGKTNLELAFGLDPSVYDGRFANNGWLQELPDPISKLTWDNAAVLSPKTARELGVQSGDILSVAAEGASAEIVAFILPGVVDYSIQLAIGYGRSKAGAIGDGVGTNVNPLRTSKTLGHVVGATITKTGRKGKLATTRDHWTIADHHVIDEQLKERGIVRQGTLEEFEKQPDFVAHQGVHSPDIGNIHPNPLDEYKKDDRFHQWGMTIDLNACLGCNACTIACQSENNIPIVGKDEVINGREMHWLRMDRYFEGADPEGEVTAVTQPMMCQHCENAPCEPVCPVNATVHDEEGLNAMVYNRCIGTRYCANNCPYKVRRFNFFDYNKGTIRESGKITRDESTAPDPLHGLSTPQSFQPPLQELLKMAMNPDVTVRMRGVMEKCTYCVQRIQRAKIDQNIKAGQSIPEKVPDGTIQTACQQVCPTQAIVFGNLKDEQSRVSQMKTSPRSYDVLSNLNTRPRTSYLARIRNVNPKMPGGEMIETKSEAHTRLSLPILGEVRI